MSLIHTRILSPLFQTHLNINRIVSESCKIVQVRHYAARKGTRERKAKKKTKVEIQKVGFIPHNQRDKEKMLLNRQVRKYDDSWKRDPTDNVYVLKYYKWIVYPFAEAVQCHRETHHPEMYNQPNANLHVTIELNMQGEKKTRFVDNFTRVAAIPHKFDHGEERRILVFSKSADEHELALKAGAHLAGGGEIVKKIQRGELSLQDFDYVLAHPNVLPELVALRGLMKRRFPNPKAGTLGTNLDEMIPQFLHGINYTAVKDEYEKDFGVIETPIGTLNMESKQLEENFAALIADVQSMKPRRDGGFIRRCLLSSPPSGEKFKVEHEMYIKEEKRGKKEIVQDEEGEVGERVAL